jgi:hypothetical protein
VLYQPNVKGATPYSPTQPPSGVVDRDPSFAPTLKSITIAFIQRSPTGSQLCFLAYGRYATDASCTAASGWELGGPVQWSPDGKTILVLGVRHARHIYGLLAFSSSVPFSINASNWGHGTPQTDISITDEGVVAGAFSPAGTQMALVSNTGGDGFHVYLVPTGSFKTGSFKPTPAQELVAGCQVSWRSDSKELAVMQPDGICQTTASGTIVAVDPQNPRTTITLARNAAHPAWQPISTLRDRR